MDGGTDGWIDKGKDRWRYGSRDDGCMDGRKNGWMDGSYEVEQSRVFISPPHMSNSLCAL
jgi:hypothetical protein